MLGSFLAYVNAKRGLAVSGRNLLRDGELQNLLQIAIYFLSAICWKNGQERHFSGNLSLGEVQVQNSPFFRTENVLEGHDRFRDFDLRCFLCPWKNVFFVFDTRRVYIKTWLARGRWSYFWEADPQFFSARELSNWPGQSVAYRKYYRPYRRRKAHILSINHALKTDSNSDRSHSVFPTWIFRHFPFPSLN